MKGILNLLFASLIISNAVFAQETRTIGTFDELDVSESITVILKKGNSKEARIEASGGNTDRVLLDNNGGRLKVHMRSGSWRSYNAKVYLEFQDLRSVEVSSSADVIGESVIRGDELEIEVSSSGNARLDVDVERLEVEVSSSGTAEVSGRADRQRVNVSSSGRYEAFDLMSGNARVQASSSGKAEISASAEIDAQANSSGHVAYKGNPDKVYVDSNSGGRVRKQ